MTWSGDGDGVEMELGVELELGNIKYTLGWILARFCSYVSGSRAKQSSCELLSQTYGAHVLHASLQNCMQAFVIAWGKWGGETWGIPAWLDVAFQIDS